MFQNILGFIIDQSIKATPLAKITVAIVATIVATAIAFTVYFLVGLLTGGLAQGFFWAVVVGRIITLLRGAAKIKYLPKSSQFHEWIMVATAVVVATAIYVVPTVWMVVVLHTVYVAISLWSAKVALKRTEIGLAISGLGLDK